MIGRIYKISNNKNDLVYIGQTTGGILRRFNQHKSSVRYGSDTKLHRAMREIGVQNFEVTEICKVTIDDIGDVAKILNALEVEYISLYNSMNNGYNSTKGGTATSDMTKVAQYSLSGELIAIHSNQGEAADMLGISNKGISRACLGSKTVYKGYQWRKFYDEPASSLPAVLKCKRYNCAVAQYSLSGSFIATYDTVKLAEETLGIACVHAACIGTLATSGKYQWRYFTGDSSDIGAAIIKQDPKSIPIVKLDLDGNYIAEYASINAAYMAHGVKMHIADACRGIRKTAGGFMWKFKEEYNAQ